MAVSDACQEGADRIEVIAGARFSGMMYFFNNFLFSLLVECDIRYGFSLTLPNVDLSLRVL
jgi:hypothetical protein